MCHDGPFAMHWHCRPRHMCPNRFLQILGGDVAGIVEEADADSKVPHCIQQQRLQECPPCPRVPECPPELLRPCSCPVLPAPCCSPQFKKGDKVFALTPGFFNASPEGWCVQCMPDGGGMKCTCFNAAMLPHGGSALAFRGAPYPHSLPMCSPPRPPLPLQLRR